PKGVNNDKVIAPGMFRISPDKVPRKEKKVPNTDKTILRPEDHSLGAIQRMIGNKEVKVEEHHRNLLLSKKNKHSSSACNNSKIDSLDKCLNSVNHDECLVDYVNGKKSRGRKHKANVSKSETQQKNQPEIKKPKNVRPRKSLATPKPRFLLRWSPTGKMFDSAGRLVAPSGCSKQMTGNLKLLINFVWKFMGTVRFGNDHVAAILGFGDLQ
nr:integrase, catalytic region, zinc finger, CCHC-type, peptidase aspartic, catalytic [Tanacetum cinerariifolium]